MKTTDKNLVTNNPTMPSVNSAMNGWRPLLVGSLLAAFLLAVAGCASMRGYPKAPLAEAKELKPLIKYFTMDVVSNYNALAAVPPGLTDRQIAKRQKDYRDEVVMGRMRAYDLGFTIFEKSIYVEKNQTDVVTDWAVLGLAGYGTVGGSAATKAILHAISGGLTGARLSFDQAAYMEKTMPAILGQMEASRSQIRVVIRTGLTKEVGQYSLMAALSDLDMYYKVGTIPGAVIAIDASAGADKKQSDHELKNLVVKGSFANDDASDRLREWVIDSKGDYIPANQKRLDAWLKEQKLENVTIGVFLNLDTYDEQRAQAVKDLIR